jgi:hypothetical protein
MIDVIPFFYPLGGQDLTLTFLVRKRPSWKNFEVKAFFILGRCESSGCTKGQV